MNNFNIFLKLKNLLYIYQASGYKNKEFLRWTSNNKERFELEKKKKLDWTLKAKLIYVVAIIIILGLITLVAFFASAWPLTWFFIFVLILGYLFGPIEYLLIVSNFLLIPLDRYLRARIVSAAKKKLGSREDLIVIGITGSYGKTTMSRFISGILSKKYKVLHGKSSFNTPIGVSRVILDELTSEYQVLVVEMGADHVGDIKALAAIVKPKIGVLTGINEAHLETFGNIENTIKTKFELADGLTDDGTLIINGEDSLVMKNYHNFVTTEVVVAGGLEADGDWSAKNYNFDGKRISFDLLKEKKLFIREARAELLGKHNVGNIVRAVAVAERLGLTAEEIKAGISALKAVEHRLEPIYPSNGVIVIDDSYNGNPEGVRAAIEVLSEYPENRKVYLTPGLVGMGLKSDKIHQEIGKNLSKVADLVLLIKNKNTEQIVEGLKDQGYPDTQIKFFESSEKAYNSFESLLKPGDVILFQNDLPDSYK